MKKLSILFALILSVTFLIAQSDTNSKVQVLNFGTFHMGGTSDAHKTEYDEHDKKNQTEAQAIAAALSEFKPTVIIVELVPERNEWLQKYYADYVQNPDMKIKNPSELELLAFEVGRLSSAERIYGIDHRMGYNYRIAEELESKREFKTYNAYMQNLEAKIQKMDAGNTWDKLRTTNQPETLDFLLNINADILTHVSTEGNFEGADEAAKFYQRNLRMYSNLNQLDLQEDDRVFILMGATHTAFFREFMERSPKYELVNVFDYLKQ